MRLRRRFIAYLLVVHALLAAAGAFLLRQDRLWLIAVEATFAVSLLWGLSLLRQMRESAFFVQQSTHLLDDGETMTRFVEVGHPELDQMIRVYNRMVDSLRDERVRLQEQQYFLGRLLEASPAGVVTLDLDGRIAAVNPAAERLFQHPAGEWPGRPIGDLPAGFGEALGGLDVGAATLVTLPGGRRVRCQRGAFVDRGFARSFFLIEELTDELRRTEKAAYEKLIRMMSHEVNNSVGAARSLLESAMAYGAALPDDTRADLESALRIAMARMERLNAFTRSFADVVRIPDPRRVPSDIDALVEGVVRLVQAQAASSDLRWTWVRQQEVGTVKVDPAQMEQVFLNVLKNAAEAAGPAGSVTLRLGREDGSGFVEVEDSGPGIPDEIRPMLFTPFFTTKQNGQGIGLTVVQEILTRHGFDYSLDGPPGGPTRFRVTLGGQQANG